MGNNDGFSNVEARHISLGKIRRICILQAQSMNARAMHKKIAVVKPKNKTAAKVRLIFITNILGPESLYFHSGNSSKFVDAVIVDTEFSKRMHT